MAYTQHVIYQYIPGYIIFYLQFNHLYFINFDDMHNYSYEKNKEPTIYNYVSSVESSIHWDKIIQYVFETYHQAPPLGSMWFIFCIFSTNRWFIDILRFLLHRIPAAFVDLSFIIRGKNPK